MNAPASASAGIPPNPFEKDLEHLNLLGIFHFIGAGLALLGLGLLFVHLMIFRTVFIDSAFQKSPNGMNQDMVVKIFMAFYAIFGFFMLTGVVLNFLAGLFLRSRTHRTFCMVVAALNCLQIPLGLVLGIFTFVVLSRPSVRTLFDAEKVSDAQLV